MTTTQAVNLMQNASTFNDKRIVPGRKAQVVTTAACNSAEAKVMVEAYQLPTGIYGPLIDRNGYRPQPDTAVAPTYISGPYQSGSNPLEFFDIGSPNSSPDGSRQIAVTFQATKEPCGQWNAMGTVNFKVVPLTYDQLDFEEKTKLKEFAVSEFLYFGFGTTVDPGFIFEQKTEFFQSGYFGVIQLISGDYQYQLENSNKWHDLKKIPDYVLDTPEDTMDPVNQRVKIGPGIHTIHYRDAPGLDLKDLVRQEPAVSSVQIDVKLKTYFMFNPSSSTDPNADLQTTWYPISPGLEWQCSGVADCRVSYPKDNPTNWRCSTNRASKTRSLTNEFPVWTSRMHEGNARGVGARDLIVQMG